MNAKFPGYDPKDVSLVADHSGDVHVCYTQSTPNPNYESEMIRYQEYQVQAAKEHAAYLKRCLIEDEQLKAKSLQRKNNSLVRLYRKLAELKESGSNPELLSRLEQKLAKSLEQRA